MGFPKTKNKADGRRRHFQMAFLGAKEWEIVATFRYRPRIRDEQMQKLWALKRLRKQSITRLIAEALDIYLDAMAEGGESR